MAGNAISIKEDGEVIFSKSVWRKAKGWALVGLFGVGGFSGAGAGIMNSQDDAITIEEVQSAVAPVVEGIDGLRSDMEEHRYEPIEVAHPATRGIVLRVDTLEEASREDRERIAHIEGQVDFLVLELITNKE